MLQTRLQVLSEADTLLRRKCAMDTGSLVVDMESSQLINRMFKLIIGSPELLKPGAAAAVTPAEARTWQQPASHALQIRLLRALCGSKAACNSMPMTLQVRAACMQHNHFASWSSSKGCVPAKRHGHSRLQPYQQLKEHRGCVRLLASCERTSTVQRDWHVVCLACLAYQNTLHQAHGRRAEQRAQGCCSADFPQEALWKSALHLSFAQCASPPRLHHSVSRTLPPCSKHCHNDGAAAKQPNSSGSVPCNRHTSMRTARPQRDPKLNINYEIEFSSSAHFCRAG